MPGISLERVRDEAVSIRVVPSARPPVAVVELASGSTITAAHVVLALGNLPPADPGQADDELSQSDRYEADPWDPALPERVRGERSVLLLGTGLTMVDVALTLGRQPEPESILTVSRQGLLPQKHRRNLAPPNRWFELPPSEVNLSELISRIESEVATAQESGGDWRQVIDALRPYTNRIWRRLSEEDREQFVQHLSRRWDIHRHRMAPRDRDGSRGASRIRPAPAGPGPRPADEPRRGRGHRGCARPPRRRRRLPARRPPRQLHRTGTRPLERPRAVLGSLFRDGEIRPRPTRPGTRPRFPRRAPRLPWRPLDRPVDDRPAPQGPPVGDDGDAGDPRPGLRAGRQLTAQIEQRRGYLPGSGAPAAQASPRL